MDFVLSLLYILYVVQYVQNIENMWCAVHTVLNSVLVLAGGVRDMVLVVIN